MTYQQSSEEAALIEALDGDTDALRDRLAGMYPGELEDLRAAAQDLADECKREWLTR